MQMFHKINILHLTGFQLLDYKKCKANAILFCLFLCFNVWVAFAFIINMTSLYAVLQMSDYSMTISLALSNGSCLITFITLYLKKSKILKLTKIVKSCNNSTYKSFTLLKIFQIFNLCFFVFFPVVSSFFFKNVQLLFIMYCFVFNQITLPLSITVLYANFCCWCSTALKRIEKQIKNISVILNENRITRIFQDYQYILHICLAVESAFSIVAFILMASYIITIFTYMGNFIRHHHRNYVMMCQMSINLTLEVFGMTILIVFAS